MTSRIIFICLSLFFLLNACIQEPRDPMETSIAEHVGLIQSAHEPIQAVADGRSIALWADPPTSFINASYFWEVQGDIGSIENNGSQAIYYKTPASLENLQEVTIIVTLTNSVGGKITDHKVIQLVPSTPTPTLAPTDTLTPTPTNTPTFTPSPTPTLTPTPTNTPTLTPSPTPTLCPLVPIHITVEGSYTSEIAVRFQTPLDCGTVIDTLISVRGTYEGDMTGLEMYIFVVPEFSQGFFVQASTPCEQTSANFTGNTVSGEWNALVSLGGGPQRYDLVAMVTPIESEGSKAMQERLSNLCETGHLPSFSHGELNRLMMSEVGSITIRREESE